MLFANKGIKKVIGLISKALQVTAKESKIV